MLLISLLVGKLSYKKGKNSLVSSIITLKFSLAACQNDGRINFTLDAAFRREISGKPYGNYGKLNQVNWESRGGSIFL
jgi:hypothetical protein